MEGKVPGGHYAPLTESYRDASDDKLRFSLGDASKNNRMLNQQHRNASMSLPRFVNTHHTDESTLNKSATIEAKRKHKSPSIKSFGNFVQKMVRQMSEISLHQSRHRTPTKRCTSEKQPAKDTDGHYGRKWSVRTGTWKHHVDGKRWFQSPSAGIVGIRNHGNTCFMNAVLQCLCHTELLVEYFLTDQYKSDLKRNNKRSAKKYGTKGELTEHLAVLLKSLWTARYSPEISNRFTSVVGKFGNQYRGTAQHDAQEFLLWLLDKIHEDLNIAVKKKYRPNKSSQGRSDESVAAEALANHMRSNNSFIYDLFQALYRSSLTCPGCERQSNTFDPFLSMSLPIPQKCKKAVYVTVVYLDARPRQVRIGLLMDLCDTVKELRHTLASDTNIPAEQLILTELYMDGFRRTFHDSHLLSDFHDTDNVYAIETPPPVGVEDQTSPQYMLIVVLNMQAMGMQTNRFGGPFVLQVAAETGFKELQKDILQNMASMLKEDIHKQMKDVVLKLRVADGLPGKLYLPQDVDHPLLTPTVDRALSNCVEGAGPEHLKLTVEWDRPTKQRVVGNSRDVIEEHLSVHQVSLQQQHQQEPEFSTLSECFQLYTQEETLGADDAWFCPNCLHRQQGTVKRLSLWSLPDILVIHLKRFKQVGLQRTKLNTLITFPVHGLDMTPLVAKQHLTDQNSSQHIADLSPWQPNRRSQSCPGDFIYDLYAVCNHYGNMQGGHYTACCKNFPDGLWYTFDDTKVTRVSERDVVSRAAYLLFYQRRSMLVDHADHWLLENVDIPRNAPVSKSHEDLLTDSCRESSFRRNVPSYATMRSPPRATSQCALHCTSALSRSVASLGLYDNLATDKLDGCHVTDGNQTLQDTNVTTQDNTHDSDSSRHVNGITTSPNVTPTNDSPATIGSSVKVGSPVKIGSPTKVGSPVKVGGNVSVTTQQGPTNAYWDYSQPIMLQESCV